MTQRDARILIIGGGFGGLFTALDLVGAGEITLINNEDHFLFKPMLYEYLSGEVEAWHIAPDCKELLNEKVRFIRGVVTNVDLDARKVTLADQPEPISYDVLY
jgi:NADH dehydrogenase